MINLLYYIAKQFNTIQTAGNFIYLFIFILFIFVSRIICGCCAFHAAFAFFIHSFPTPAPTPREAHKKHIKQVEGVCVVARVR